MMMMMMTIIIIIIIIIMLPKILLDFLMNCCKIFRVYIHI
jgi:hypothetical protein